MMKFLSPVPSTNRFLKCLAVFLLMAITTLVATSPAEAIPAFARKYDMTCTSCHTKPPRLNAFGEAFHMSGYQIPMTKEGELRKKRRIGRINSEIELLNIFALRATGNFAESFSGGNPPETNLALPREIELYFGGTFTNEVSYFFNLAHEGKVIEGLEDGSFEEKTEFGLGKEFFLMFDLRSSIFGKKAGGMGGPMVMGPMIMVGKVDPSTNFSYSTNRQFILNAPGRVNKEDGEIQRFTLTPYAFASKFFGLRTGNGKVLEVTRSVLYNTSGDFGLDVHAMVKGKYMLQAGVMQGIEAGTSDANEKKDPYLMARMNFGGTNYFSGSISGLANWGNDTAMVNNRLIDWFRYGVAANVKYKLLDVYGALIWDDLSGLPSSLDQTFDRSAVGLTVEGDLLVTDQHLISIRYDQMSAGGFISQKADGKVLTFQVRKYFRDNFAIFVRDSVNIGTVSDNPLQNFRNLVAVGVDLDF